MYTGIVFAVLLYTKTARRSHAKCIDVCSVTHTRSSISNELFYDIQMWQKFAINKLQIGTLLDKWIKLYKTIRHLCY